jgi:lysophospholipase L1-like esterase
MKKLATLIIVTLTTVSLMICDNQQNFANATEETQTVTKITSGDNKGNYELDLTNGKFPEDTVTIEKGKTFSIITWNFPDKEQNFIKLKSNDYTKKCGAIGILQFVDCSVFSVNQTLSGEKELQYTIAQNVGIQKIVFSLYSTKKIRNDVCSPNKTCFTFSKVLKSKTVTIKVVPKQKPVTVVSLGDSYASGEGVEPFYDQDSKDRNLSEDFLCHRSEKAWSGAINVPGLGNPKEYKGKNWYFKACSGAKIIDVAVKEQKRLAVNIPRQLSVFDKYPELKNNTDFVTLSLGGNDAGFIDVITRCLIDVSLIHPNCKGGVNASLGNLDEITNNLKTLYKETSSLAGKKAKILVTGYPHLFSLEAGPCIAPGPLRRAEMNEAIDKFDSGIAKAVEEVDKELGGNSIRFVDVRERFYNHEVCSAALNHSVETYINPIWLGSKKYDLKQWQLTSEYSLHPNEKGIEQYVDAVNEAIGSW